MSEIDDNSSDTPSVLFTENEYESDNENDIVIYKNRKSSESNDFTDAESEAEGADDPLPINKFLYIPPATNYEKQSPHLF